MTDSARAAATGGPIDSSKRPIIPNPPPRPAATPATKPAVPAPRSGPTPVLKPAPGAEPKFRPRPAAPAPAPAESTTSAAPAETTAAAAPPATASAPLRDPYHQAPRDTVSQQVYDGWKQFNLNCARCHGEDVQGTTIAPHLIVSVQPDGPMNTKPLFVQTVCAGRPEKGMPAWCPLGMEADKIEAIYQYVKGRSDGQIHAGRPAVKPEG